MKVTAEVAIKMATLAVNASSPMGMGFLHYNPRPITEEMMAKAVRPEQGIFLDYVEGRMVKLWIPSHPDNDGTYKIDPAEQARVDYQSWAVKYPTYGDLARAAGAEVE